MSVPVGQEATTGRRLRLAFVLWSGNIGGAEMLSAELATAIRTQNVDVSALIVGQGRQISRRLEANGISFCALGFRRGSRVLVHPRRLARAATRLGSDGVVLQGGGYLAAALRAGGYRGRIVAVEHGALMNRMQLPAWRRAFRVLDHLSGVWAVDALVAVSDSAMLSVRDHPHPEEILCIYNGVDVERFRPLDADPSARRHLTIGFAGRLIEGKGADDLIRSLTAMESGAAVVRIAGDGPERRQLKALARDLGTEERVSFVGTCLDMPAFWRGCDVAVVPSRRPHIESFGLVAAEAMACGLPVVATANGALPELVEDGHTGMIVPESEPRALAAALDAYVASPELRILHGRRGRARAEDRFSIDRCAQAYVELFRSTDENNGLSETMDAGCAAA